MIVGCIEMSEDSRLEAIESESNDVIEPSVLEPQANEGDGDKEGSASFFTIGTVVDVMPRLWPGINKPGGVGRVYGVHYDEGSPTSDIPLSFPMDFSF